ncbi:ATP-grasp domain-containing protein [Pseudomonas sp. Fl5BN2]|uniref:ATP-grasp domain-containing protein n=1 Tax=Pseudomonas sp. Fl5BN2 TaxID=2697652 RepID=UPI0013786BF0|nr:ATP-grasp domain-containing protein [Pseudomonas sp. Fl5BN2]NBF04607.1 ATP-grasp domain-containing protein [Pseudomonas sp. Fl5BN2]
MSSSKVISSISGEGLHLPATIECAIEAAKIEGWSFEFVRLGKIFALLVSSDERTVVLPLGCREMYPGTPADGAKICRDKWSCYSMLAEHGVPIISGTRLIRSRCWEIDLQAVKSEKVTSENMPMFIKPVDGCCGESAVAILGWEEVHSYLKVFCKTGRDVVLQPYVCAREIRLIVLNGVAYAGYERKGPFILGDGVSTYMQLCADLLGVSVTYRFLEAWFGRLGIDSSGVSVPGVTIEVPGAKNLSKGGDAMGLSNSCILKDLQPLTRKVYDILQVPVMGVDIFLSSEQTGVKVIEVNASPDMSGLVTTGDRSKVVALWRGLIGRQFLGSGV